MYEKECKAILEELDNFFTVNWGMEKYYYKAIKKGLERARKGEENEEVHDDQEGL